MDIVILNCAHLHPLDAYFDPFGRVVVHFFRLELRSAYRTVKLLRMPFEIIKAFEVFLCLGFDHSVVRLDYFQHFSLLVLDIHHNLLRLFRWVHLDCDLLL